MDFLSGIYIHDKLCSASRTSLERFEHIPQKPSNELHRELKVGWKRPRSAEMNEESSIKDSSQLVWDEEE